MSKLVDFNHAQKFIYCIHSKLQLHAVMLTVSMHNKMKVYIPEVLD